MTESSLAQSAKNCLQLYGERNRLPQTGLARWLLYTARHDSLYFIRPFTCFIFQLPVCTCRATPRVAMEHLAALGFRSNLHPVPDRDNLLTQVPGHLQATLR